MLHYSLKSSIPTESTSNGLHLNNNVLYFASNTFVYKVVNKEYETCGFLEGKIKQIKNVNNVIYAITGESLVLIYDKKNIASMKIEANSMIVNHDFIVLGVNNALQVWALPKEYKLGMFNLCVKTILHNDEITCLCFFDTSNIITGSRDCSTMIYNMQTKQYSKYISTKSTPIKILRVKGNVVVICEGGQIYFVNDEIKSIEHKIYKNTEITCADQYEDFFCICTYENSCSMIEIYNNRESIYRFNLPFFINELSMEKNKIGYKGQNIVGIYSFDIDVFAYSLDLPKISCFDMFEDLVCVGCTDKKIRLYNDKKCLTTFYDDKNNYPILFTFCLRSSVMSISTNGYISLFDMKNNVCFRSFNLTTKVSYASVCDDGMFLFITDFDSYNIKVVDLQRSKEIDTYTGHKAPIKNIVYANGYLFSFSIDNEIKKWDIYTSECVTSSLEKTITSIIVKNHNVYILTSNEILIYDYDFEYKNSIAYKSKKPYEHITTSFDDRYIFLGGETNKILIIKLATNTIDQTIKVSRNKKWKNYRETLRKNQVESFDKSEKIEVCKLLHSPSQYKISYLTREGLFSYESTFTKCLPLLLDLNATTESIAMYISEKRYLNAIIVSLKLSNTTYIDELIVNVSSEELAHIMRYLPPNLVESLRSFLIKKINSNFYLIKSYEWMRYLILYHGKGSHDQKICKKTGETIYNTTMENLFLLENLIE